MERWIEGSSFFLFFRGGREVSCRLGTCEWHWKRRHKATRKREARIFSFTFSSVIRGLRVLFASSFGVPRMEGRNSMFSSPEAKRRGLARFLYKYTMAGDARLGLRKQTRQGRRLSKRAGAPGRNTRLRDQTDDRGLLNLGLANEWQLCGEHGARVSSGGGP